MPFAVNPKHRSLYGHDFRIIETEWTVKPGDVCFDVGFGPGTWSLYACSKGATVYAFDPRLYSVQHLTEALLINKFSNCLVIPAGLLDVVGSISFNEPQGKFEEGYAGFPVTTLDAFAARVNLQRLDFVNLDVEAAECKVIKGGRTTLTKLKPKVIVEVHSTMGVTFEQVEAELRECGYTGFKCVSEFLVTTRD